MFSHRPFQRAQVQPTVANARALGRACALPFASFEIALRSLLMPLFCADRGIMRRRASSGAVASCLHRPSAYLLVVAFWPCDLVSGADFRAPCRPGFEIIIASASAPGHFCTVRPSFRHTAAQRSRNRWYPKHPHSIAIHSDVWAVAVTVAVPVAMPVAVAVAVVMAVPVAMPVAVAVAVVVAVPLARAMPARAIPMGVSMPMAMHVAVAGCWCGRGRPCPWQRIPPLAFPMRSHPHSHLSLREI